jgi:ATP-dependent helicase/nuclease subunit B
MSEPLGKTELLARLAAGHAAAVTVVTPNLRLARALAADFDRGQRARGLVSWETPDVLPLAAFAARLYEDALYSEGAPALPRLLAPVEEALLWEDIVRGSNAGAGLLAAYETARLAREAWALVQAYGLQAKLARALKDEDAEAFAGWAARYAARTTKDGLTDAARLPDVVRAQLDAPCLRLPKTLVTWAFERMTPQQRALLDALAGRGVAVVAGAPEPRAARAVRCAYPDQRAELAAAARWARARLEANPDAAVGVVVPGLATVRPQVARVFARTLDPGGALAAPPFNLSLGVPLAEQPLVAHALAILELGGRELDCERASLVLRSPFVAGAEVEAASRATADARLRRRAGPRIALDALAQSVEGAPQLARLLARYAEYRRERLFEARAPRAWAEAFDGALKMFGFPGERTLSSAEYQAQVRWTALLAEFGRTERVSGAIGFREAQARLAQMAADALFQPESGEAPIQVLGALEAAGLEFDHLWVSGLTDEAWPLRAAANPFVPLALQREANVPGAGPAETLADARAHTAGWLAAADEVVISYPSRESDRALSPSALVLEVKEGVPDFARAPSWRDCIHASRRVERIDDARAPVFDASGPARGGASLLRDQAACPFRAFARHRLASEALEAPHAGLDAMERGILVHRVLAAAWGELRTKSALDTISGKALDALLVKAAGDAVARMRRERPTALAGRFAAIEAERLARIAREWLEIERARGEFEVVAREDAREIAAGPLSLKARLDRVDDTSSGRVVIDYKTGRAQLGAMLGARMEEPQLPLYLVAAEPEAAAVAFAQVRAGDMRFVGLAREAEVLPGTRTPAAVRAGAEADWPAQVKFWRREITRLADDFAAGNAAVDPKDGLDSCRYCEQQPLYRVHERLGGAEEGE